MTLRSSLVALAFTASFAVPSLAFADAAPDEPCDFKEAGDACETEGGDAGICQTVDDDLECVVGGATTAATTAAATTAAATTAATTGASGSGGGGSGGGDGSGGSVGGGETDDGCAVRAPNDKTATHIGAAAVFAIASAIAIARRRRRG